jgi:hypothetical protein
MNPSNEIFRPHHKRWSSSKTLFAELNKILSSDVFREAEKVLIESAISSKLPVGAPIENHALINAYRDGYFDFLHNMRTLACPPAAPNEKHKPLPPPFEGYTDERSARKVD